MRLPASSVPYFSILHCPFVKIRTLFWFLVLQKLLFHLLTLILCKKEKLTRMTTTLKLYYLLLCTIISCDALTFAFVILADIYW